MYPQIREKIKYEDQVVHYFLRKRDFIVKYKVAWGLSIFFWFIDICWAMLGSSYDKVE
jgi:hypothetical protein